MMLNDHSPHFGPSAKLFIASTVFKVDKNSARPNTLCI